MKTLPKLHLASSSPRRRQILEAIGLPFQVIRAEVDEIEPSSQSVDQGVIENAELKAKAALKDLKDPSDIVITADTLVVLDDQVLGKPKNSADVISMLTSLSGRTHRVVTGMAIQTVSGRKSLAAVSSWVTFKNLSADEMKNYAATREPYDKAGSYAIQGLGTLFIEKIEGSYTNIMGFPVEKFLMELPIVTGIPLHHWF